MLIDRLSRRLAIRRFGAAALGLATVQTLRHDEADAALNYCPPPGLCHTNPGVCAANGCVCCGRINPFYGVINSRCMTACGGALPTPIP